MSLAPGFVCFVRPERAKPRVWNAKKVGQVCKQALKAGETPSELQRVMEECLGLGEQCDCALIRELIGGLLSAIASILIIVGIPRGAVMRGLIRLIRILVRRFPGLAGVLEYLERRELVLDLLREIERQARQIELLVRGG